MIENLSTTMEGLRFYRCYLEGEGGRMVNRIYAQSEYLHFVSQLFEEGLVDEEDRDIVELILPDRLKRLYDVLNERTRYISVLTEAVDDGHNQAAVLRSADAFGIQDTTVVTGRAAFAPNDLVTRSADKWLTIHHKPTIETAIGDLRQQGYQVFASHLSETAVPIENLDISKPTVLIFGNEHQGVSKEAIDLADGTFIIPMRGFVQSLNISVAAALAMRELTERAKKEVGSAYYLTHEEKKELFRDWMIKSLNKKVRQMILDKKQLYHY